MAQLVEDLPHRVHLAILSRVRPDLPLARWRARGSLAEIDTDKSGSISREEFIAHHQQMKGPEGRDGDRKAGHGGRGHGGMKGMMMGGGMAMMADANKDGTVTRAEFDAGVKAHFDMADANKDGKITPEERRASMKAMMSSTWRVAV